MLKISVDVYHHHGERHGNHWLLAAFGPFVTGESNNTMPQQQLTVQNTTAPSVTSFKVGPFDEFNAAGDEEGPDALAVVVTSSDQNQATVAPNGDGTSTVSLVPGTSAGFTLSYDDSAAGGKAAGSCLVTVTAPPPNTLQATFGAPIVTG